MSMKAKETLAFYLFLTPWGIGFIVFLMGPLLASLVLSFTNWDLLQPAQWVGLANYKRVLFGPSQFWLAMGNTAYYALILVPLSIVVALILAVLLNQNIILRRFFRTVFYLPATLPIVAVVFLWQWILAPSGILNEILGWFGIHGPAWFVDPAWIKPGLILMGVWAAGSGVVLFLAGLQGIPKYMYEASAMEGAGPIRQFLMITVPMLSPIVLFNLINGIIGALQVFTQVYIIARDNKAAVMAVPYLYHEAFGYFKMGYASAVAWIFFIFVMALTLVVLRWSRSWVYYEGEVR
jgi:multiple sugar transport system permease protein